MTYKVQFIQYIFNEAGNKHLIVTWNEEIDFVPSIGMFIDINKPYMEWEFQIEKVVWDPRGGPKSRQNPVFTCKMKKIKFLKEEVDTNWLGIEDWDGVVSFYEDNKEEEGWRVNLYDLSHSVGWSW
jgi:hypothetical protein